MHSLKYWFKVPRGVVVFVWVFDGVPKRDWVEKLSCWSCFSFYLKLSGSLLSCIYPRRLKWNLSLLFPFSYIIQKNPTTASLKDRCLKTMDLACVNLLRNHWKIPKVTAKNKQWMFKMNQPSNALIRKHKKTWLKNHFTLHNLESIFWVHSNRLEVTMLVEKKTVCDTRRYKLDTTTHSWNKCES